MSGFGDELNSVLQSPLTQTLAPAILGGVGGALSAPPMLGRRGAIGYGLQGGAQGLTQGMQLAGEQKRLTLDQQKAAAEQEEAKARLGLAQEQLKHQQWVDQTAREAMEKQDRSIPTLRKLVGQAAESPAGQKIFGGLSADDLNNVDYDTLLKMVDTYGKASEAVLKAGKLPNGHFQQMGDRMMWAVENPNDPSHPFLSDVGPGVPKAFEAPNYQFGTDPATGALVKMDTRSGTASPATFTGGPAPKGITRLEVPAKPETPTKEALDIDKIGKDGAPKGFIRDPSAPVTDSVRMIPDPTDTSLWIKGKLIGGIPDHVDVPIPGRAAPVSPWEMPGVPKGFKPPTGAKLMVSPDRSRALGYSIGDKVYDFSGKLVHTMPSAAASAP